MKELLSIYLVSKFQRHKVENSTASETAIVVSLIREMSTSMFHIIRGSPTSLFLAVLSFSGFGLISTHVSLRFPPARKYALDFLSTLR